MKKILFVLYFLVTSVYSQILDTSFANEGHIELPSYEEAIYTTVDSEQNIYCLAKSQTSPLYNILKVTPNGEIDTNFGNDGSVSFNNKQVDIFLTENKILSLGYFQENNDATIKITSLNSNGTLDENFGDSGVFSLTFNLNSNHLVPVEMWEHDDGYIIGCYKLQSAVVFIKVLEDETLDTTYGNNGIVETPVNNDYIAIRDFKQDDNGNLYACAYYPVSEEAGILKINNQGVLDGDFGENGAVALNFHPCAILSSDRRSSINIFNGYIYVVGEASCPEYNRMTFIAKLDAVSGELDDSYGTDGVFSFYPTYGGYDSLMQENGQIIISALDYPEYPLVYTYFYRIGLNGEVLNTNSFDSFSAIYYSLAFQGADRFVAAGKTPGNNLIISRYNSWPLNLEDYEWNDNLKIFPNPTQQNFSIRTKEEINQVKIFDVEGRLQYSFLKAESYPIGDLLAGVYFVEVSFKNGFRSIQRIIKK